MSDIILASPSVRKTEDGLYSVYDAITFISQKKNAPMVWKRLVAQYPEEITNVTTSKFPGQGQKETPVADKATIIEIIALLPGNVGGKTRKAAVELLLQYIEAPDELAKRAIARITDKDKLRQVHEEAYKKYITHYHPLMGEIKQRSDKKYTYQHINALNTKTVMGKEPALVKAERGGETARTHATSTELGHLWVLQDLQAGGLKKFNAQGHVEVCRVAQSAADDFQAMLEKYGVG